MRAESSALHALRFVLPSFWIGLLVALAFIETPLKFLAPGMTLELALGLGRLVLTAADLAGAVLLVAITVVALLPPRTDRAGLWTLAALWIVLLLQLVAVRPLLNARTELVLAGADPGESPLHALYVAADLLLLVGLLVLIVLAARRPRLEAPAVRAS